MALVDGLYWEEHGPKDAPPLILSPGLGGLGYYWRPNLAALSADYRVILYDHRGTGRSAPLTDEPVTVAAWADDLVTLIDAIGAEKAHIVGHAAGGVAGLRLALDRPERVDRLAVVNGWSQPDPHFLRCFDARLHLLRDSGIEAYVRAQPIFLYTAEWISRHDAELAAEAETQIAHFPSVETVERRIAALRAFDIDDRLCEIASPVLALGATDDMLVPCFRSARLAEAIPNARLETMVGGHACTVTKPATFAALLLDFLRS